MQAERRLHGKAMLNTHVCAQKHGFLGYLKRFLFPFLVLLPGFSSSLHSPCHPSHRHTTVKLSAGGYDSSQLHTSPTENRIWACSPQPQPHRCLCTGVICSNPAVSQKPCPFLHTLSLPAHLPSSQLHREADAPRLLPAQGWRASPTASGSLGLDTHLSCPFPSLSSPEPTRLPRKCWKGFSASLCWGFQEPEQPPPYL